MRRTTIRTFAIAPTDSKSAITTTFILTLWEINLKGLSVRSNLRILNKLEKNQYN